MEAVVRVVGERQAFGLVVERDGRDDRPEDLLAGDLHRVVDAVEDRRLDEVAAALRSGATAADDDSGASLTTGIDVAEHLVEMWRLDHRADPSRRILRVADRPLRGLRDDP